MLLRMRAPLLPGEQVYNYIQLRSILIRLASRSGGHGRRIHLWACRLCGPAEQEQQKIEKDEKKKGARDRLGSRMEAQQPGR